MTKQLDVLRKGFDQVAPNVYVFMTGNTGPNSMVVVGDDEVLLVDALMTTKQSAELRDAIASVTSAPVKTLIYSHRHGDHILGAEVFAPVPTVIGTPSTVEFLRTVGDDYIPLYAKWRRTPEDAADVLAIKRVVVANIAVESQIDIFVGETRVRVTRQELAHSPSDLFVTLPDLGIVATGDVYAPRIVPGMRDGRVLGWLQRLQEVYDSSPAIIVPGHGPWSDDRYFVKELRDFLETAYDATHAGLEAGRSLDEIIDGIDKDAWSMFYGMNRYPEVIARMVEELDERPSKYDEVLEEHRTR